MSLLKWNSAVCCPLSLLSMQNDTDLKEFQQQTTASVAGELLDLQNILHCSWSLGANVWEEHSRQRSSHTRPARKSPLLKADALPAQCVFKTEPAACLQSTDHRTAPAPSAAWGGECWQMRFIFLLHTAAGADAICVLMWRVFTCELISVKRLRFDGRRARSIWCTNSSWISLTPKTNPQTRCPWFKCSGFFSRYWVLQV